MVVVRVGWEVKGEEYLVVVDMGGWWERLIRSLTMPSPHHSTDAHRAADESAASLDGQRGESYSQRSCSGSYHIGENHS